MGIFLSGRINVTIRNMEIISFWYGVYMASRWLYESSNNSGTGIIIMDRYLSTYNNRFYQNNLINNIPNAYTCGCIDFWDADLFSGPYQNISGSDGIWGPSIRHRF